MRVRTPLITKHTQGSPTTRRARTSKPAKRPDAPKSLHGGRLVQEPAPVRPPMLHLRDLECVRKLGTGAYGSVLLVRVRPRPDSERHDMDQPGSLFALKVLHKEDVQNLDRRHSGDIDSERASLAKLPWSPWVNGVVGVFHDPLNLYLMLECIPAGVLHDIIYRRGPLDATMARFYYANIACALEFLHGNGIVHRDLKPANILVKPDGYIALVDFGLATPENDAHTWAIVGTPIYMAPELSMSQAGVGSGVDWFSSGIILYEMVTQRVPFYGKEEEHVMLRVANKKYKWPRHIRVGKLLKSMVAGLLTHEALSRLGVAKPVMEHAWLSGIDWKKMHGHSYLAPWIPGDGHLCRMWQDKRLPPQKSVPDLRVVTPPEYLKHDRRLPRKRSEDQQARQEEVGE